MGAKAPKVFMTKEEVRKLLSSLTRGTYHETFCYDVGLFRINIGVKISERIEEHIDNILNYPFVHVFLYERMKDPKRSEHYKYLQYIDLEKDSRFKNYLPIKYGITSSGDDMPIEQLIELILYLNRLTSLVLFK